MMSQSDPYQMPRMEVLRQKMAKAKIFSTIDLTKGYYQVPMDPRDKHKTSFIKEFGKFQFLVMPFGLKNAPSTFQRMMDNILRDMTSFSRCYIDDIVFIGIMGDTLTTSISSTPNGWQRQD